MWEDVIDLYANTIPFYIKDLSIYRFSYLGWVPWNQPPSDSKGLSIF